jgi:predicted patatin/cPLA2 family phospholipase
MTAQKSTDTGSSRSSTATTAVTTSARERKPWKKKTPVEVVLDQIDRLRDDVAKKEEEFKQAKRQLEKLEAARKVLEAT